VKPKVIDSSVALALLFDERGADKAMQSIAGGLCCSVNVTEIVARLIDVGQNAEIASGMFLDLGFDVVPFNRELGILAGQLRESTKHLGLSLGDRACLALAIRENGVVVTADLAWRKLDLGIEMEFIR